MGKILVVRRPDKTIHQVAITNKAYLMAHSNRLPAAQQFTFEEMDEDEAKDLPTIDINYVTQENAKNKLEELDIVSSEKDAKIAELEKMIAELNAGKNLTENAVDVIARINAATSAKEVKEIAGADGRKTVIDAAMKMIGSF